MITQERLKELFTYRESDGALIKKLARRGNTVGSEAGSINNRGYRNVLADNVRYSAHRLIFLMHHGWLPPQIDHINGNPSDNRIENLRAATASTNGCNRTMRRDCGSGVKNVSLAKGRWRVTIRPPGGKTQYFGSYADLGVAEMVAAEAREALHGQFANHGTFTTF